MTTARRRVAAAERRLEAARHHMLTAAQPWRRAFDRHRGAALVGGGFALGLGLALLPLRWWSRAGAFAFQAAARTARASWLPALFATRRDGKPAR